MTSSSNLTVSINKDISHDNLNLMNTAKSKNNDFKMKLHNTASAGGGVPLSMNKTFSQNSATGNH